MLTPPEDLPEDVLASVLTDRWGLALESMTYRPVGFGSHHWEVADTAGTRWFVTVDELETRRRSLREPLDAAYDRLRAALTASRDLHESGRTFAVAPVPTGGGDPLARADGRFGVALYPFVEGRSFGWGELSGPEHRQALLDLVIGVHTAPAAARRHALADDFAIPHRDELEAALAGGDIGGADAGERGRYARPTALLLAQTAAPVRRLLARYDELVGTARAQPSRAVLTHGEPHPGNTMRTPDGWLLIDWDTALVAPPERDLWSLDPGDGSLLGAYAEATGVSPVPAVLELYRIGWDLADLALYVDRFRRPHRGNSDDDQSWRIMRALVAAIAGPAG